MSLLRRTRTEMAGAWRSLRYDLGRTPTPPPPAGGPDVTSTGMGTWGWDGLVEQARPDPAPPAGRPRRAVAMTAFGVLTVAGAAGAYLAVVNGLGSLVSEPVAADTLPPRVAVTSDVGMGPPTTRPATPTRATVVVPRKTTVAAVPPPGPDPLPSAAAPPPRPAAAAKSPIRTTKATSPECQCRPPVPTPTAPTSSPSPTPSPSPSESPSAGADPSPSESAEDPGSSSPSRSGDGRRHRRHH